MNLVESLIVLSTNKVIQQQGCSFIDGLIGEIWQIKEIL
jgi:hypothetical protein